jgi:hypothetical protein
MNAKSSVSSKALVLRNPIDRNTGLTDYADR